MEFSEAIDQLREMTTADGAATPADTALQGMLAQSVIPDEAGRMPGEDGWEPTWDLEWAAALVCEWRAARAAMAPAGVKQFTSEGTSVTLDGPTDWQAAADQWRRLSRIWRAQQGTGVSTITILGGQPPYIPTTAGVRP